MIITVLAEGMRPKFKHLLVDLDGTLLANREVALTLSFFGKIIKYLKEVQKDEFSKVKSLKAINAFYKEFSSASDYEPNSVRFTKVFSKELGISEELGKKYLVDGVASFFPKLKKYFTPVDGAKEFLEWAKDHYTLTLATNPVWPVDIITKRLSWSGVDESLFDWITHWEVMRAVKPLSEYYQQILDERGFEAKDCLLIGDSVRKDLPATRVGISVFVIGKEKDIEALPERKNRPQSWMGNYNGLKALLSES